MSGIQIFRYIDYSRKNAGFRGNNSNYGSHCMGVSIVDVTVFFSYVTPVAFWSPRCNGGKLIMCQNKWGPTTGKHLSAIYRTRSPEDIMTMPEHTFREALDAVLDGIFPRGASRKVRIVEKRVAVERIRKIVVPRVYKTVCPNCQAREAKMAEAEKRERNILL